MLSGARAAAAAALARVLDDGVSAQPALHSVLSSHALSERDRALCTELFYGTLRLVGPLEKSLLRSADKPGRGLDERIRPHLLIAAYQLQHLAERVPAHAVVNEAVDAVGRTRPGLEGFANALLRRLGSPLSASLRPDAPLEEIADAWGVPHALARAVVDGLPAQEHAAAIAALSARPATWAMCFAGPPPGTTPHRFVPGCHVLPGG